MTSTGRNLAERMDGYYGEFGCDVAPWLFHESNAAVIPFVRYEHIDTQASMPSGYTADPTQEDDILTVGVRYQPMSQIVLKLEYTDSDQDGDAVNFLIGYVF